MCLIACSNKQVAIPFRKRSDEHDFKSSYTSRLNLVTAIYLVVCRLRCNYLYYHRDWKIKKRCSLKNFCKAFTTVIPHASMNRKSVSSPFREDVIRGHIGIHNDSDSLNLKAPHFEIIDIIQSEFSHLFSDFNMSLIKYLRALLPASNCFLDKEDLQFLCFLVNSTFQKYQ